MSLCRNKEPRPQDTLQELHAVHGDMMQSTGGPEDTGLKTVLLLLSTSDTNGCLTTVSLVGAVHTVPVEVTPALGVDTLPARAGELFV